MYSVYILTDMVNVNQSTRRYGSKSSRHVGYDIDSRYIGYDIDSSLEARGSKPGRFKQNTLKLILVA